MFIRRTNTRNCKTGEAYFTHRLVETMRVGNSVKQFTLLNLGSHFDVPQENWPALAARIDELLRGQSSLLANGLPKTLEVHAQRYAAQLIARRAQNSVADDAPAEPAERFQDVDVSTLELVRPRSVGVEHAALATLRQLGFEEKLSDLGFNRTQIAAAVGNVIGRMAAPGSELATYGWLQNRTALGELIGYDYEGMDLQQLYRSADRLLQHRDALEAHLFKSAKDLFGFVETITLYDLTNTYFEGSAPGIAKARNGKSKENRSDCPLVTLALVLDASGFPKRSQIFAGNVSEAGTLKAMLEGLEAASGFVVAIDAGIATEANLVWLKEHGYHYVVVIRKRTLQFDPDQATEVPTAGQMAAHVQRVQEPGSGEVLLYCHSPARAEKDKAIDDKMAQRFEAELQKIAAGLAKRGGTKDAGKLRERIGRLKERYARAAQHYAIEFALDSTDKKVTAITWSRSPKPGSAATHPGVYCLRTTLSEPDDAALWRIYSMLTNLEAVFRSLKTDLDLRPVYHQIQRRVEGHLFISVLAYYVVHTLRQRLKAVGINDSWETLRNTLSSQVRITATLQRRDGRTVHVRKASRPEPPQQRILTTLKLLANPGGTQQTLI
jgi:transposase